MMQGEKPVVTNIIINNNNSRVYYGKEITDADVIRLLKSLLHYGYWYFSYQYYLLKQKREGC